MLDRNDSKKLNTCKFVVIALLCCAATLIFAAFFLILLNYISASILPFSQIDPQLLEISYSELLTYFGVVAGVCYSIWAYRASRQEKEHIRLEKKKEEELAADKAWEEFKPDLEISLRRLNNCFELSIENIGIKHYRNVRYGTYGLIADRLFSGETRTVLVCKPQIENRVDVDLSKVPRHIIDFDWYDESQFPQSFFIGMYDSRDCYWMIDCEIKEGRIVNYSVTNG